jgi:pyruvate/2-oxoglutarate/acetoin dehydrogenase E1 component
MREITFREAMREAIFEEMERDPSVFLMGESIAARGGVYQQVKGVLEKFGEERILDMPISESGFIGTAVGAALLGTRPVVDLQYDDFLPLALDHLINDAAKMRYMYGGKAKVPLVIRTFFGAGTTSGCSHSQSLEAMVLNCPGLKVVMPSTPADAKGLLKSAIRDDDPVVFFEHRLLYATKGEVPDGEYVIPLGEADVKREGRDVTVVATALMVHKALGAATELSKEGIEIEVLDPRSLLPLDCEALLNSVKKTGRQDRRDGGRDCGHCRQRSLWLFGCAHREGLCSRHPRAFQPPAGELLYPQKRRYRGHGEKNGLLTDCWQRFHLSLK